MLSSQQRTAPRRTADPIRLAPYFTDVATHHGQLSPISPQSAARVRKTKKKRANDRHEHRDDSEEPRFTTSVPPTPSRRLPSSAPPLARSRKQIPPPPRVHDPLLDVLENPVPDYPPPSFQEAISAPYPYTPASASSDAGSLLTPQSSVPSSPSTLPSSTLEFPSLAPAESPTPFPSRQDLPSASHESGSGSDESSVELVNLDPLQRWEANHIHGPDLQERVAHKFIGPHLTAPRTPHSSTSTSFFVETETSRARLCSHCGSVRPLKSRDPDGSDDDGPRHQPPRTSRSNTKVTHLRNDLDTSSAPSSPSSISPTSFASMASPWASSVTLSLGSVFSSHKSSPVQPSLKRKESFDVRRLFSKGKDRECSPINDELDSWEVVDPASADHSEKKSLSPPKTNNSSTLSAAMNRPLRRKAQSRVTPFTISPSSPLPCPPPEKPALSDPADERRPAPAQPPKTNCPRIRSSSSGLNSPVAKVDRHDALLAERRPGIITLGRTSLDSSPALTRPPGMPTAPHHGIRTTEKDSPTTLRSPDLRKTPASTPSVDSAGVQSWPVQTLRIAAKASSAEGLPPGLSLPVEHTASTHPSTPTTPMSGHHYPGRPLPRPPTAPAADALHIPSVCQTPPSTDVPVVRRPDAEFSQYTDLDVLMFRLDDQGGRDHENLLAVSDIIRSASPSSRAAPSAPIPANTHPFVGRIELEHRPVMKADRVRLKLSLLGVAVDNCGICLSQFKHAELAALAPVCQHSFHERCLRRWLALNRTCPLCRVTLSLDDTASSRL